MKKNRPILNLPISKNEKILNLVSLFGLALMIILVLLNYSNLPDRIPIHFGFSGKADSFGSKAMIWVVPILAGITYFSLRIIRRGPHQFNYPVKITAQNAEKQYQLAQTMIASINLATIILLLTLLWNMILVATGKASQMSLYTVIPAFLLIFVPLLIYRREAKKIG